MKEFIINKNDAGQRMDKFITKAVPALPKNLMYKYLRLKRIKLNGKRCEISTRLAEGDSVTLYINDEFFEEAGDRGFLAAPAEVRVVYEDENILLADKPSWLVVHEDERGSQDTLIGRILHYLYGKGEYQPEEESSFVPALCNRIDRNTSGIVICAKNAEALRIMNEKVKNREMKKTYLCITAGLPPKDKGELRAFHTRDERTKTVTIFDRQVPGSRTMVTRYRVLDRDKERGLALVEAELVTGRTHQIRAHFAHEGFPLLGDGKYGINRINREYNIKTQALCSYRLTFEFRGESGSLSYLDGRSFTSAEPWFARDGRIAIK